MRATTKGQAHAKITTVDGYLANVSGDKRAALQKLRKTIQAVAPRAEECISYGLPAFRLNGRMLVWFGAAAHHCSFYPGAVVEEYKDDLKDYKTSKGTIRFAPDDPLPVSLVRTLVKARIAENAVRAANARKKSAARG
jgi:uncharacterized protein YdhG (YjbR/CyaY superfamily)